MRDLTVRLKEKEHGYKITVEKGLIRRIGEALREIYSGSKVFVLTDDNVDRFYGQGVVGSLENAGFKAERMVLPAGERTKTFGSLPGIYERLLDSRLTRGELIMTLGGGVIGDLGGFAAATYLRGVPFVQVPTSLLAQVDSSVGGKVGVDLERGKNLVGSFCQPRAVFIDPEVLNTLPDRYFIDGMAEVIKTGCILDGELFGTLEGLKSRTAFTERAETIISRCCYLKKTVVEADEKEEGARMLLNFGHTLGHAIEKYYGYEKFSHGEAVAIGMYKITKKSEKEGLTQTGTASRLGTALELYRLPTESGIKDENAVLGIISVDKKNVGGKLNAVLLKNIGNGYIYPAAPDFFKGVL